MQLARVAARTDRGLQLHRVANNRAFIGDMRRGFCTLVLFILSGPAVHRTPDCWAGTGVQDSSATTPLIFVLSPVKNLSLIYTSSSSLYPSPWNNSVDQRVDMTQSQSLLFCWFWLLLIHEPKSHAKINFLLSCSIIAYAYIMYVPLDWESLPWWTGF